MAGGQEQRLFRLLPEGRLAKGAADVQNPPLKRPIQTYRDRIRAAMRDYYAVNGHKRLGY